MLLYLANSNENISELHEEADQWNSLKRRKVKYRFMDWIRTDMQCLQKFLAHSRYPRMSMTPSFSFLFFWTVFHGSVLVVYMCNELKCPLLDELMIFTSVFFSWSKQVLWIIKFRVVPIRIYWLVFFYCHNPSRPRFPLLTIRTRIGKRTICKSFTGGKISARSNTTIMGMSTIYVLAGFILLFYIPGYTF